MGALRNYQSEAVQKIMDFYDSDEIKAKLYIGNGLGRNRIAATAIEKIVLNDPSCSVMVVFRSITECEQFYTMLSSKAIECNIVNRTRETNSKVQICSFHTLDNKLVQIDDFDLVVDFDSKGINESDINRSEYRKQHPTRFIAFIGMPGVEDDLYKGATCIFSYSYTGAIRDGYNTELSEQNIERFLLCQIFPMIGFHFSYEQQEKLATYYLRPDMIMEKDGEYYLAEIKYYRSRQYSSENLKQVIKQMCYYRSVIKENGLSQYKGFVVIMLCQVKDSVIHEVYEQYGITIWDIRNLFYLCQDFPEAEKTLEIIFPSPIGQIVPTPPLEIKDKNAEATLQVECIEDQLIAELKECVYGKENKADKKYENLCTKILSHLFSTEFLKTIPQHTTTDDFFRMDMICSLKGTTAFWQFLIHYFHTKFVVFEYKNYKDAITQNLIYITEKYLYPAVLRNVAFIISRNGFHPNAEIAAMRCLTENGKLIVSLNDEDICNMLLIKKDGGEPSDYLLNKIEDILMSVSK